jgi:hypothetical protein
MDKLQKGAGQYQVHLGLPPAKESTGSYAQWHMTKEQLGHVLKNWDKVQWERRSDSRPSAEAKFHSTAITRNKLSKPIANYLERHGKPTGRVLYHGVGRDDIGAKELGAYRYDPYHPDSSVRQEPNGKFDEVHSHYTLNVVDKDTGFKILSHIHGLLSDGGKAVVSVRRDLKKTDPKMTALAKGAARRIFGPFNPDSEEYKDHASDLPQWQEDANPEARDTLFSEPNKMTAGERHRAFNKLAAKTKMRRNILTGEREFLLHRGMSKKERDGAIKKDETGKEYAAHTGSSSWTPHYEVARGFAADYSGLAHDGQTRGDLLSKHPEYFKRHTVSAWIPESKIKGSVHQLGHPNLPSHGEHEIIVAPNHNSDLADPG